MWSPDLVNCSGPSRLFVKPWYSCNPKFLWMKNIFEGKSWFDKIVKTCALYSLNSLFFKWRCLKSKPNCNNRHAAIDPTTLNFFALNELVPIIDSYKIDAQTGQLTLRGSLIYDFGTAIGGEEQKGGEIALHPFLPILYITHRGNGAVLVFEITDVVDGTLNQIQALPVNGTTPRHFAISDDGKFLVVANRFENKVQTFKIQAPAGTLTFADEAEAELQASFIAFKWCTYTKHANKLIHTVDPACHTHG